MVFFKSALECASKKRDRKATEQAIKLAASRLFAEKGYENTRTLEIAKAARANEALIGRYFGGKEGLLIAIMKDDTALDTASDSSQCNQAEYFPTRDEVLDFKTAIAVFFKNGLRIFENCQEFVKIGASRALLDPEMAEVLRKRIIDQKVPQVVASLKTYPELAQLKKNDLEATALLLMSVNFNLNFMGRKIYGMTDAHVNRALELLGQSLSAHLLSTGKKTLRETNFAQSR